MTNIASNIPTNLVVDASTTVANSVNTVVLHDIAAVNAVTSSVSAYDDLKSLVVAKSD